MDGPKTDKTCSESTLLLNQQWNTVDFCSKWWKLVTEADHVHVVCWPCTCTLYVHRYVHYLSNKGTLDLFYSLFLKGPMDVTIGFVGVDMELSFDNISFKIWGWLWEWVWLEKWLRRARSGLETPCTAITTKVPWMFYFQRIVQYLYYLMH